MPEELYEICESVIFWVIAMGSLGIKRESHLLSSNLPLISLVNCGQKLFKFLNHYSPLKRGDNVS